MGGRGTWRVVMGQSGQQEANTALSAQSHTVQLVISKRIHDHMGGAVTGRTIKSKIILDSSSRKHPPDFYG